MNMQVHVRLRSLSTHTLGVLGTSLYPTSSRAAI
jgi:hypothetical protein